MKENLPKRKATRLRNFEYGSTGAYFITVCVRDRMKILSEIVTAANGALDLNSVGDGALDVPQTLESRPSFTVTNSVMNPKNVGDGALDVPRTLESRPGFTVTNGVLNSKNVGDGALDVPQIRLTEIGKIVERYLLSSEQILGVEIDEYAIMPDHIHAIIFIKNPLSGTSRAPSPTAANEALPHIVSTFKRFCNKDIGVSLFQRSYYDHVIRDRQDYELRKKYIYENPIKWYYDKVYEDE